MTDLQLPAHLLNRANRGIAAQLALSLPSGAQPYLSIEGNRFTLYDAAGNERQVGAMDPQVGMYVDVVVADSNPHISKIYYGRPYDKNLEGVMPKCFSDNGIGPSSRSPEPQHATCNGCPNNEWGSETSRLTGKGIKACSDKQNLAIVVPGQGEMVFLLRVPAASLKHLGKYIQELGGISAGGRKVDICDVITRIFFHKDANGILGFSAAGWVDAASQAIADKAYESKATDALVGKNDRPYTGEVGVLPAAQPSQERRLPPPFPTASLDPAPEQSASFPASLGQPTEPKKRGRPRKEPVQEAPATQPPFSLATNSSPANNRSPGNTGGLPTSGGDDLDVPDFLKRIESAPGMPPASQPTPKPTGPSFGMQSAQAAPEDMAARIAAVLAMKTGG
jgi:hypothetical protein